MFGRRVLEHPQHCRPITTHTQLTAYASHFPAQLFCKRFCLLLIHKHRIAIIYSLYHAPGRTVCKRRGVNLAIIVCFEFTVGVLNNT